MCSSYLCIFRVKVDAHTDMAAIIGSVSAADTTHGSGAGNNMFQDIRMLQGICILKCSQAAEFLYNTAADSRHSATEYRVYQHVWHVSSVHLLCCCWWTLLRKLVGCASCLQLLCSWSLYACCFPRVCISCCSAPTCGICFMT